MRCSALKDHASSVPCSVLLRRVFLSLARFVFFSDTPSKNIPPNMHGVWWRSTVRVANQARLSDAATVSDEDALHGVHFTLSWCGPFKLLAASGRAAPQAALWLSWPAQH